MPMFGLSTDDDEEKRFSDKNRIDKRERGRRAKKRTKNFFIGQREEGKKCFGLRKRDFYSLASQIAVLKVFGLRRALASKKIVAPLPPLFSRLRRLRAYIMRTYVRTS